MVKGDPLAPAHGTCGSGTYERVVQAKGITSQGDLNAIATAYQAKFNVLPKKLRFETDRPGLQVGQKLSVNLPPLDLASTDLLITSLDGNIQSGVLEFLSRMRWTVEATNTSDQGNWLKWFERLIRRTELAPPLDRFEIAGWALNGGAVLDGVQQTNPYTIKNSGQLIRAIAVALNGPIDEDLTLDIVSAEQGSLLSSRSRLRW